MKPQCLEIKKASHDAASPNKSDHPVDGSLFPDDPLCLSTQAGPSLFARGAFGLLPLLCALQNPLIAESETSGEPGETAAPAVLLEIDGPIGADKNSTIVFPLPVDLLKPFLEQSKPAEKD